MRGSEFIFDNVDALYYDLKGADFPSDLFSYYLRILRKLAAGIDAGVENITKNYLKI